MLDRLTRDSLSSEISGLERLLGSLTDEDEVGRISLEHRRAALISDLTAISHVPDRGAVILSFDGGPVVGSRGIDSEFAAGALHDYQDLVAKQMAASAHGELGMRGPVPSKAAARLNIVSVVHGSFGFALEEHSDGQTSMLDSSVATAIQAVDKILAAFGSNDQDSFLSALSLVDRRVFISAQSFFERLYATSATLKIEEESNSYLLNRYDIMLARERITGVDVVDEEVELRGELLGITPVSRRFDFVPEGGAVISGQIGQKLSQDYLERLHGEERISGQSYLAKFVKRIAKRADRSTTYSYILLDLGDIVE